MKRILLSASISLAISMMWVLAIHPVLSTADSSRTLSQSEIERILDAPSKYTYVATGLTKSWYNGKSLSSDVKIYHKVPGKHRIEYLTPPLKGLVCVDDGRCAWRFDPKLRSVVGTEGGCAKPKDRLGLLLTNYRVEQTGSAQVAGRRANILDVRTRSGELRKRLWVDEKTYIILISEDYAAGDKLISKTALATIDYNAKAPDSLYAKPTSKAGMNSFQGGGQAMSYDQLSKALGFKVKVPGYVPKGFKLDAYRLYKCPCQCGHKSAYTRYTNGLGSISVFETAANSGCLKKGGCQMRNEECAVREQTAMLTSHGMSYIIISDVAPRELKRIADSLR